MERNAIAMPRPTWLTVTLAALLSALLLVPYFAGPARASQAASTINSIEDFSESTSKVSDADAAYYADAANLSTTSLSGLEVEADKPQAWMLDDGSVYVSYQLLGEGVYASNVGAILTPEGTVSSRTELAIQGGRDSGTVKMWVDGEMTIDQTVAEPEAGNGEIQPMFSWSKFNSCLSNAGVPAWAITAISIACIAACVGTAGVGCVVCASAAAGVAGGTIGYCVDEAS